MCQIKNYFWSLENCSAMKTCRNLLVASHHKYIYTCNVLNSCILQSAHTCNMHVHGTSAHVSQHQYITVCALIAIGLENQTFSNGKGGGGLEIYE